MHLSESLQDIFLGDSAPEYASAWGGANWFPASRDNGEQEQWDTVTYRKFLEISATRRDAGILPMNVRAYYERPIDGVGIETEATGQIWFEELVGGLSDIPEQELPFETVFGFEFSSFVIDVQRYLPWLQTEAGKAGINTHRRVFTSIHEALHSSPEAQAVFNCTGLGALSLGGVEDTRMYPARGQILLIQGSEKLLAKMAFRAPERDGEATHVFPREYGRAGVILGGCRQKGDWNGEPDLEFAEVIKRRCCALVPELGSPDELRVIKHGVGLRPGRVGGARILREFFAGRLVIHNYGAGGTGFQASW